MARDTDRNAYHTVGIPKDSLAYQRLVQEAAESNISLPSLIALRVADWYRLTTSGAFAPAAPPGPNRAPQEMSEGRADHEDQARANAEAAAAAWLN